MHIIDHLLMAVSPSLMIPRLDWQTLWRQKEYAAFMRAGRALCLMFFLLYFLHYFLVDIPAKKEPLKLWAYYRFTVSGLALAAFTSTFIPWIKNSRFYKLPVFLCIVYTVYMQGQSMIWRAQIPFFYVPLFAMFGALSLRLSILSTLTAYFITLAVAWQSFICRPLETQHMVSASLVGAVLLTVLRSRLKVDLSAFLLEQRHLEAQKKLIETQLALSDQLRAFLPTELFRRAEVLMRMRKQTPLQAIDEVLRPRKAIAAVLHSDIRGFTGMTKTGDQASLDAIIPAQKACTNSIEKFGGIPRLQGDLVYSYFDNEDPISNILSAINAGFALYAITEQLNNQTVKQGLTIKRYAIISFGPVIVGNIGGTEGARDISVIGNAANIPSRLDSLTKEPSLSKYLDRFPIILSTEAYQFIKALYSNLDITTAALAPLKLSVRDFPEEQNMNFLWVNETNINLLKTQPNQEAGKRFIFSKYSELFRNSTEGSESDEENTIRKAA